MLVCFLFGLGFGLALALVCIGLLLPSPFLDDGSLFLLHPGAKRHTFPYRLGGVFWELSVAVYLAAFEGLFCYC